MATTVGQHSVAAFTSPVNGTTPIDANTVRGNDNTVRSAYVDHDADPGIHVQSSSLASRPAAGTAGRKWITEDSGVYTLWFDDGTNWHPVSSENVALTVLAGENLVKGDVVKVTGWNNGQDLPEVVKTTSASDTAFAVITATVSSGSMGYATNTGIVQDVNTAAYSVGTILYANGSGGFTSTKPTSGNYQPVAYVLRANASNGVYYVEFSTPRIVERSDNTASTIVLRDASGNFSAGTITAGALTSTGLVTFASLKGTGATTVTNILDEDNMASDSATALATQQSIKAYVDAKVATVDTLAEVLANGNTTGANNIIVSSGQKITTNTIDETTAAAGVTIDSVLLKDDVVNATDIEVDTISANNGTLAVTLGSTGVATIAQQPILSSLTASQAVFTDASKGLVSNAITGTGNVVMSASPTLTGTVTAATINATTLGGTLSTAAQPNVTSLGTLANLTVTNPISGSVTGSSGSTTGNAATATALQTARNINGVSFNGTADITVTAAAGTLTGTTLASGVTASSLTSVGTLTSLTVSGDLTVDTSTLKVDSTNNRVGIGTATPGYALDVVGGSATALRISGNSAATNNTAMRFYGLNAAADLWAIGNAVSTNDATRNFDIYDLVAGANRLRIDSSGNLGLGTSSPTDTGGFGRVVDVQGSTGAQVVCRDSDDTTKFARLSFDGGTTNVASVGAEGTATQVAFRAGGGEKMRLDASGNLGLGVTPSAWGTIKALQVFNGSIAGSPNNNILYQLGNAYYDGSAFKYIASDYAAQYRINDSGKHAWYSTASGTAGTTATFGDAKMTLDASGNLGVGTTSPSGTGTTIEVKGATGDATMKVTGNTGGNAYLQLNAGSSGNAYVNSVGSGVLIFGANGVASEAARITSGGFLLVGTTTTAADARLVVENTDNTSGDFNYVSRLGANCNDTSSYHLICGTGAADKLYIYGNGNVVNTGNSYGTLSDVKLKQDIVDATSQWDDVKAIRFRKYRLKADVEAMGDAAPVMLGVVAQELQAVSPGLIDSTPDREQVEVTDEDGNVTTEMRPTGTETLSVKSSILLMKAAVALQEAMARIEALEARLEALEA